MKQSHTEVEVLRITTFHLKNLRTCTDSTVNTVCCLLLGLGADNKEVCEQERCHGYRKKP